MDLDAKERRREYQKQYRLKNKEKLAKQQAEWRKAHKEEMVKYASEYYKKNRDDIIKRVAEYSKANKEKITAHKHEYYITNKEKISECFSEYYQKNKDNITKRVNEYYYANKEKISEYSINRRKTPMGRANYLVQSYRQSDNKFNRGECTLTSKWIVEHIFSQPCHYCGESDWTKIGCDRKDNSLPHTPDNVVPCCYACNCKKNTKNIDEYMLKRKV